MTHYIDYIQYCFLNSIIKKIWIINGRFGNIYIPNEYIYTYINKIIYKSFYLFFWIHNFISFWFSMFNCCTRHLAFRYKSRRMYWSSETAVSALHLHIPRCISSQLRRWTLKQNKDFYDNGKILFIYIYDCNVSTQIIDKSLLKVWDSCCIYCWLLYWKCLVCVWHLVTFGHKMFKHLSPMLGQNGGKYAAYVARLRPTNSQCRPCRNQSTVLVTYCLTRWFNKVKVNRMCWWC